MQKNRFFFCLTGLIVYQMLILHSAMALDEGEATDSPVASQPSPSPRAGQSVDDEITSLHRSLYMNPRPVRIHYELGLLYEKQGRFDKAVAEYKEGLKKYQEGKK